MAWHPPTYNPADGLLETRQQRHRPYPEHQCPGCLSWVRAERLIDVRSLLIDQTFACDGCWTDWQRRGVPVNGEQAPANRKAWLVNWLAAHNAPQEAIEKVEATRDPDAYGRIRGQRKVARRD